MTLTTNTTWIEYVREGRALCWFVEINRNGTTWTAVSGGIEITGYPPCIVGVDTIAINVDPGDRRTATTGKIVVRYARDGWIESVIAADWLRGAKITIKLGPRDLSIASWVTLPLMYVVDLAPEDTTIGLVCEEWTGLWSQTGDVPRGVNVHPLEVIENHIVGASIPTSIYDSTSLDPQDASHSAISHLNCTIEDMARFPAGQYWPPNLAPQPTDADSSLTFAEEALMLINGYVRHNENGQIEVGRTGSSAVRNWTTDDVRDVRQVASFETIATRFIARYVRIANNAYWTSMQSEHAAAQTALSIDGGTTPHIVTRELEMRLINASGKMRTTDTDPSVNGFILTSSSTYFEIVGAGFTGWTGCRFGGSQIDDAAVPTWARVSASKPAYVMLFGNNVRMEAGGFYDEWVSGQASARPEIIKITDVKSVTSGGAYVPVIDASTGRRYPRNVRFTIAASGRAQYGTTTPAVGWRTGAYALDVTVPMLRLNALLGRYDYGVPFIECSTGLHEWPVEVGDLVTLTHPTPVVHKSVGITTAHVWEVIGKELHFGETDSPRIQWTLAWYTDAVKPTHTATAPGQIGVSVVSGTRGSFSLPPIARSLVSLVDAAGSRIVVGASQVGAPASVLLPY